MGGASSQPGVYADGHDTYVCVACDRIVPAAPATRGEPHPVIVFPDGSYNPPKMEPTCWIRAVEEGGP